MIDRIYIFNYFYCDRENILFLYIILDRCCRTCVWFRRVSVCAFRTYYWYKVQCTFYVGIWDKILVQKFSSLNFWMISIFAWFPLLSNFHFSMIFSGNFAWVYMCPFRMLALHRPNPWKTSYYYYYYYWGKPTMTSFLGQNLP